MELAFYIAGTVAIAATVMMITRLNVVHALLYLIVSLLALAVVFYILGAPFAAALEVIIYAGAIMVLFVFVVMLLNLGEAAVRKEETWLRPRMWIGPSVLIAVLIAELLYLVGRRGAQTGYAIVTIGPEEVGNAMFGPYMLGAELASMLLLAGLLGAYHLGYRQTAPLGLPRNGVTESDEHAEVVGATEPK